MDGFREVDHIFSGLEKFAVASKSMIVRPYRDGGVFIGAQILETLDDGMEVELCLWTDCELQKSFWDVSIDKQMFAAKARTGFTEYLMEKGFFLENVKDRYGSWRYLGPIEREDVYRIQYYEEDGAD